MFYRYLVINPEAMVRDLKVYPFLTWYSVLRINISRSVPGGLRHQCFRRGSGITSCTCLPLRF